ncbi:MAG: TatD family hydrolase, partial [Rhodospirillaceae bacterium]|nr:TatD family hydrolase [Rhodospirillaceae bacterium]
MPTSSSGLPLVDAHAHLYAAAFADDLDDVLARAAEHGVQAVLCVSETLPEAQRVIELADRHPLIKPCAGLYPTILDRDAATDMLDFIRRHRDRLAAIGEVGLDYWKVQEAADREL